MINPQDAVDLVIKLSPAAIDRLNEFSKDTLQTRGGRAGSGLGSLLEALWGFMINCEIMECKPAPLIDMAWFPDHAYNDFACLVAGQEWDPASKAGELFRVESKSMYRGAEESKAHFDALQSELGSFDLLLLIIWSWVPVSVGQPGSRVFPKVHSSIVTSAMPIAEFRDALHLARGGSFVAAPCPDGCTVACSHIGEPLNADGKRERRTGPASRKPANASYAANFGGMVRMLKTNSPAARAQFRKCRVASENIHEFVSFMHASFPEEEANQYLASDWKLCAQKLDINPKQFANLSALIERVRKQANYQDVLRQLT